MLYNTLLLQDMLYSMLFLLLLLLLLRERERERERERGRERPHPLFLHACLRIGAKSCSAMTPMCRLASNSTNTPILAGSGERERARKRERERETPPSFCAGLSREREREDKKIEREGYAIEPVMMRGRITVDSTSAVGTGS